MSLLTCSDFLKELNDFLDENADPCSRAELERHVQECPNCWVLVDTTKRTLQVFKGEEPQELPSGVHERLMEALDRKIHAQTG
jgi:hypothetical protein